MDVGFNPKEIALKGTIIKGEECSEIKPLPK